jgi:hypothetical protein
MEIEIKYRIHLTTQIQQALPTLLFLTFANRLINNTDATKKKL